MAGKSIITNNMERCLICGSMRQIEIHHCVFGRANRKLSDQYGLVVPLCIEHHRGRTGVHQCRAVDLKIKKLVQRKFEEQYDREKWFELFGRNYL